MELPLLILLPFVGSVIASLFPTHARNAASGFAGIVALAVTILVARLYPEVQAQGVVQWRLAWLPTLGLDFVVRLDGLAWMFALLAAGIGCLVTFYARYYMSPEDPVPRFFAFLLAFMGAMLGVVTAGNLVQLVFFWEVTSIYSFLLIGYWHHRRDARRGAYMSLAVTGTGGFLLLAGVLLLGRVVGSYDLDAVLGQGAAIREHALYPLILALVLAGAFTKSAQFPFHFWLPHAMAAPTPVSAYLHSAAMVKVGVFLLMRLWSALAGTEAWFIAVSGAGAVTLLLGAWCAMFQRDLKGLLAYSTMSHLGLITLLLGLGSPLAAVAAVFHAMNHATFKSSLFMAAGIIDHETGTRDMRRLHGLFRAMPITGTLAIVASAAMAGVPLLNGFLSKEMFFAETFYLVAHPAIQYALPLVATLAGTFAVVYALRVAHGIFFGEPPDRLPHPPHEPVRWMRVPIELLVLACIAVGVAPALVIGDVLATAARPVVGGTLPHYDLALWHGFNAPLLMSLLATVGGLLLYRALGGRLGSARFDVPPFVPIDGQRLFERTLAWGDRMARALARRIVVRRLQPQIAWMIVLATIGAALAVRETGLQWGDRQRVAGTFAVAALWTVGVASAVAAAWLAKLHRFAALTMLGVTGLMVCITFVLFSAPDLALTQLVVESVTVVLFLLGLRWLPKRQPGLAPEASPRQRLRRARDLVLAVAAGAGLATLSYALLTRPAPQSISPFFLDRALPEGGGTNVINVMLVDFRSFDTLGEITVLGAAALTVYALLRRFRPPREAIAMPAQQRVVLEVAATDLVAPQTDAAALTGYLKVPAVLARLMLPLAVLVALHLFLRGHNLPGGGFVAGLVVAIAFIMQYLVAGASWIEARLTLNPARWIAVGLLTATLTGAGAWAVGYPFLTTHTAHVDLPLVGEMHIPSALFFDVGVFAVVTGSTLLVLLALAHQSIRARRAQAAARADALAAAGTAAIATTAAGAPVATTLRPVEG
ncbi:MAG: monovalent cation/H+ antiporter subunit A [Burkholderiales bacterium]|nr:monovalent cation/H+ antiporter subunit A [Burkholderiales bacterium]